MIWTCVLLAMAALEVRPAQPGAVNDELRAYLTQAAENNPGLHAQYDVWQAALKRIPQVTSLDDPMFTFSQSVTSGAFAPRMTLQQAFPWFGTLRARGDKAAAEAEAELQRFYVMRDEVFRTVRRAYYEMAFLADQIRVMDGQIELLKYMEDIVRSKLALGLATDDEVLRVSMRKDKAVSDRAQMQNMKPVYDARLSEALGLGAVAEHPWPQTLPEPPGTPGLEAITAKAAQNSPALQQYAAEEKSWDEQKRLAKKAGYPNFIAMLDYTVVPSPPSTRTDPSDALTALDTTGRLATKQGGMGGGGSSGSSSGMTSTTTAMPASKSTMSSTDGRDEFMLSLGLTLPIWRKKVKAGIEEAELRAASASQSQTRAALDLRSQAQEAIYQMQDAQRRRTLYAESLLPQAQRTFDSLQQSYASGSEKATLLDVIDSVEQRLMYQLEQARALRDQNLAVADLEWVTGGAWPGP